MNKGVKLKKVISYLKGCEVIKTQRDFADAIDFNHTNLSSALNGNESYLTDGLFSKILDRFPEVDFIINGEGKNIISGNNHRINQGGVYNEENIPVDFLEIIRKKDEQIAQKDEQINKLLALLANER